MGNIGAESILNQIVDIRQLDIEQLFSNLLNSVSNSIPCGAIYLCRACSSMGALFIKAV